MSPSWQHRIQKTREHKSTASAPHLQNTREHKSTAAERREKDLTNLGFKALGKLHAQPSFNAAQGHTPTTASPPCLATGKASADRTKQRRKCGTPHCSRDHCAMAAAISAPTDLGVGGWAHIVARGATCFHARAVQRHWPRAPLGAQPRHGCARPGYLLRRPLSPQKHHRPRRRGG